MMESIVSLIKDLLVEFQTRIRNRVVSSYAFGFIAWNWRPVAVLIWGSDSVEYRVDTFKDAIHECALLSYSVPLGFALIWIYLIPGLNIWAEMLRDKFYLKLEGERKEANIDNEYIIKQKILAKDNQMYREQSSADAERISNLTEKVSRMQYKLHNASKKFVIWSQQKEDLERFIASWDRNISEMSTRNLDPLVNGSLLRDTATAMLHFYMAVQGLNVNYLGSGWVRMLHELEVMLQEYCSTLSFDENSNVSNVGIDPETMKQTMKSSKTKIVEMMSRYDELRHISIESLFPELNETV